jgi:hypothetical protein
MTQCMSMVEEDLLGASISGEEVDADEMERMKRLRNKVEEKVSAMLAEFNAQKALKQLPASTTATEPASAPAAAAATPGGEMANNETGAQAPGGGPVGEAAQQHRLMIVDFEMSVDLESLGAEPGSRHPTSYHRSVDKNQEISEIPVSQKNPPRATSLRGPCAARYRLRNTPQAFPGTKGGGENRGLGLFEDSSDQAPGTNAKMSLVL